MAPTTIAPSTPVASKRRSDHLNSKAAALAGSSTPIRQYFSRRRTTTSNHHILDLPVNFVGIFSPWAVFWGCIFLTVPVAYIYILLVLLRELCHSFPDTIYLTVQTYLPPVARLIAAMHQSSNLLVEVWCAIEAVFYVCLKLHIHILQTRDPLEASLSAAPLMDLEDRGLLWQRMMDSAKDDPVTFITGWFFDQPISSISQYDIRDFTAWSMFEGRHQEHLTVAELEQLEDFVDEVELRNSLHLYGPAEAQEDGEESATGDESSDSKTQQENDNENNDAQQDFDSEAKEESTVARNRPWRNNLPKPKKGEFNMVKFSGLLYTREPKSPFVIMLLLLSDPASSYCEL
jgi:hypothetical protein